MRHSGVCALSLFVLAGWGAVHAVDARGADEAPSLEYKPPRPVLVEPKAPKPAPPVTIFREAIGGFGIGTGSFDRPLDVAIHKDGTQYVLDAGNSRVQVFDSFSKFVLTFGSYGSQEGEFINPGAIALDQGEFVYVVDTGNHRIQKFGWVDRNSCSDCPSRADGLRLKFLISWGSLGSRSGDFKNPADIAIDVDGNSYVLDAGNERIQKFDSSGRFLQEFGRFFGSRGGQFSDLTSIAWSDERFGFLYVLGSGCLVQQFHLDGRLEKSWPAAAPESGLCVPARIEVDKQHQYVYVLDAGNSLLARFNLAGQFLAALRGAERPFDRPRGFGVNPDRDEVVVADTENNIVQKFTLR
jgi:DNA-binding beta-propeller fold protein YncE